jgi:putative ABC transport system permease protein
LAGVERVVPLRIIRESVRFGPHSTSAQVIGTHPVYQEVSKLEMMRGRFLSMTDEIHMNNVCVLSLSLAQKLFPYEDPMSEEVRVGADYYKIVGIAREQTSAEKRPQSGNMEGQPLDTAMFIPLATARSRFGETIVRRSAGSFEAEKVQLHQVTIQFKDVGDVEVAVPQIESMLRRFHKKKDYEMIVPLQLLRQAEATKRMFNIVLGAIAAISLLVGGIGIMNIMLATVTERTREIGVRRALGARRKDIIHQFLIESTVLSVGGGLIGVVLGILIPIGVSYLTNLTTIITPTALILAFGISAGIGVLFGLYPASRAASLDPIVALRRD